MIKLKYSVIAFAVLFAPLCLSAQSEVEEVLNVVVRNSARLKAAAERLDYEKYVNASEKILEDPEFGFNYLWGQGDEGGIRRDFSVSQSFDLPTLAGVKRGFAGSLDKMALIQYEAEKVEVLSEARGLCSDIVYYNVLVAALEEWQKDMQTLYDATVRRSELGDAAVLDLAKARLQLSTVRSRLTRARSERLSCLTQLRTLADSSSLEFTAVEYPGTDMMPEFDSWYSAVMERDPELRYASSDMDSKKLQLKIDKMSWVPKLNVGYMAELGPAEKYRGMTFGLSIPIWSNANKVRSSAAAVRYAEAQREVTEQAARNRLVKSWEEASRLREVACESRAALDEADPREALSKSLSSGAISVLDYILELGMYYDALEQTLLDEKDWRSAWIELQKYYL